MPHSKWVESVVAETIKNSELNGEYSVKIHADNVKDEHYASSLVFVEVFKEDSKGKPEFNWLLKYVNSDESSKSFKLLAELFRREINVYSNIIPRYHKLQKDVDQPKTDFAPKCLFTKETENILVIVLENISPSGFMLHPKEKYMDSTHIKLVLKYLAQWHALSFAFKDQHFEEFTLIHQPNRVNTWGSIFETHIGEVYNYGSKALHEILEEAQEFEVLNKFKSKFRNLGSKDMMYYLLSQDDAEKCAILVHGDCWNSNFMFQYKDKNSTEPTKVKILDFQQASLRSPVIDVSEFIYSTASSEEFKNIETILLDYYKELAKNIKLLGSNPNKIITLNDFKDQWNKYSAHGVILGLIAPIYLHLDDELFDITNEEQMSKVLPKKMANPAVKERLIEIAKCFTMFEF